ncbi:class D sortase [Gracilibacillus xinjiangensis]|uniref:Class D sortase n=1 Tax=Gracilibacillus xinjiangensis TaxID=1193282 RepID=A0ABV8WVS6_9BACI
MRKTAFLFIVVGVVLLCIGGYQHFRNQLSEKQAMIEANEMLAESTQSVTTKEMAVSAEEAIEDFKPETGETVGILEIPVLNAELPIIEGTDPDELEKGVGHYRNSAYPLQSDQIVLSGHRDTVFRNLGKLKIGDTFTMKLPYGEFEYQMVNSKIVAEDDTSIIKSTAPNEELVITTCYPFSYVGNATKRYIIYAKPV